MSSMYHQVLWQSTSLSSSDDCHKGTAFVEVLANAHSSTDFDEKLAALEEVWNKHESHSPHLINSSSTSSSIRLRSFQRVKDQTSTGGCWFNEPTKTIPQQLSRMHQQHHQDESR